MKITALPREVLHSRMKWGLYRYLVSFFLISIFYLLFTSFPANAQEYNQKEINYDSYRASGTYNTSPVIELNAHNGVQILLIEFLSALSCQLGGVDPTNPGGKCLGVNKETGEIGFVENGGGAIGVLSRLIDITLTPPTSSLRYIAYLRDNFGITKNAHALVTSTNPCISNERGVGFCAIEPLLDVWKAMRNLVYLLFIVVFIIIGIGIMLRLHIDPRTVMTIQNQIPKIIVGILAITFSFAIAGLLIDIMWVSVYLFTSTIVSATGLNPAAAAKVTHATDPFQAINAAWNVAADTQADLGIYDISSRAATSFSDIVVNSLMEISNLGWLWDLVGFGLDVLLTIIFFIAIIILLIRLFIVLILAFVNIILDIIFAPWWILAGLLPGGPLGLSAWLRDLVANLAVFPVTMAFMLLGAYLMKAFYGTSTADQLAGLNLPMVGSSVNAQSIGALIGFGFILMLPNLLKSTKAALKTPNMNFGPIFGPIGSAVNYPKNVASSAGGIYNAKSEYIMKPDSTKKEGYSWGQRRISGAIRSKIFR